MKKLTLAVLGAVSAFAMAPAAHAAITSCTTAPATLPNLRTCIVIPPGSGFLAEFDETRFQLGGFSSLYDITFDDQGSVDSSATTVKINGTVGLTFSSIFFDGNPFTIINAGPGAQAAFLIPSVPIVAGTYQLVVNGNVVQPGGGYSGRVTVGPGVVPEPATWALMLIGFGAVGYSLRRRPQYRRVQAV